MQSKRQTRRSETGGRRQEKATTTQKAPGWLELCDWRRYKSLITSPDTTRPLNDWYTRCYAYLSVNRQSTDSFAWARVHGRCVECLDNQDEHNKGLQDDFMVNYTAFCITEIVIWREDPYCPPLDTETGKFGKYWIGVYLVKALWDDVSARKYDGLLSGCLRKAAQTQLPTPKSLATPSGAGSTLDRPTGKGLKHKLSSISERPDFKAPSNPPAKPTTAVRERNVSTPSEGRNQRQKQIHDSVGGSMKRALTTKDVTANSRYASTETSRASKSISASSAYEPDESSGLSSDEMDVDENSAFQRSDTGNATIARPDAVGEPPVRTTALPADGDGNLPAPIGASIETGDDHHHEAPAPAPTSTPKRTRRTAQEINQDEDWETSKLYKITPISQLGTRRAVSSPVTPLHQLRRSSRLAENNSSDGSIGASFIPPFRGSPAAGNRDTALAFNVHTPSMRPSGTVVPPAVQSEILMGWFSHYVVGLSAKLTQSETEKAEQQAADEERRRRS
ncbi:MAG: hypothetical protein M1828_001635 [Chrysothrix sp. TS-e1954]|nr:MAG: hypothetical protein M1828_001635 [Chrysothrix sp. TS-e1954]